MAAPPGVPPLAIRGPPGVLVPPVSKPVDAGSEVAYEELVPGQTYYVRSMAGPYDEIVFLGRNGNRFQFRHLRPLRNGRNAVGNPIRPMREPHAPVPAGAPQPNEVVQTGIWWPHFTFFKINNIKRRGRFINPAISRKLKRQTLSNVLAKGGLPNLPGLGPGNTIRKFAGWSKNNFRGGKTKRKQRGGSNGEQQLPAKRRYTPEGALLAHVKEAMFLGRILPGQAFVPVNAYYRPVGDNLNRGCALLIGPRIGISNDSVKKATYPFEECIVLLSFEFPHDYPRSPPKVKHLTPSILGAPDYRIHPNLYETIPELPLLDRKVCLNLLNTYQSPEWTATKTIVNILSSDEGILGILEADPGKYEPSGYEQFYTSAYMRGVNYNKHTFAECLEYTARIYEAVINDEDLPPCLAPFREILKKRAYSALNFLRNKVEAFIRLNGEGEMLLERDRITMHKRERQVDFWRLHEILREIIDRIPGHLRVNVFPESEMEQIARERATIVRPNRPYRGENLLSHERRRNAYHDEGLILPPNI